MIVRRLAELVQLEDLILGASELRLDLSKPNGLLEGLKTLRRLKVFSIVNRQEDFDYDWDLAEMAWIRENWPSLKYVDYVNYKDKVREDDFFPSNPSNRHYYIRLAFRDGENNDIQAEQNTPPVSLVWVQVLLAYYQYPRAIYDLLRTRDSTVF